MTAPDRETCWTLIHAAAGGDEACREEFVRRYIPAVRAYIEARWPAAARQQEVDDVVQDVFIACLKENGVLSKADPDNPAGFRALLYGVTRNIALKHERSAARRNQRVQLQESLLARSPTDEASLSRAFDKAYVMSLLKQAGRRMKDRARATDQAALRRVELLQLRFGEGLPTREIAARWEVEATVVQRQYSRARREFRDALAAILIETGQCPPDRVEAECELLIGLLRS